MDTEQNVGGRDRLARAILAATLSVLALRWLKAGKRGRGLVAGVGALGFGFNATTGYCGMNDTLDIDTTAGDRLGETADLSGSEEPTETTTETEAVPPRDEEELTCAFCGEAIETGQRRGPNDQGQIVHGECA